VPRHILREVGPTQERIELYERALARDVETRDLRFNFDVYDASGLAQYDLCARGERLSGNSRLTLRPGPLSLVVRPPTLSIDQTKGASSG
jgi:hypothetical protein